MTPILATGALIGLALAALFLLGVWCGWRMRGRIDCEDFKRDADYLARGEQ